jgi:hypothetical protein
MGVSVGAQDSVVVPPGHRVVVFSPSGKPHAKVLESGALPVDYGTAGDWRAVQSEVEQKLSGMGPDTFVVVVFQLAAIEHLASEAEREEILLRWKALKERGARAVWVLPLRAADHRSTVAAIKAAGFGVHTSASDGACFVEVHKPDGRIIVGMPGPALQQSACQGAPCR